MEKSWKHSAGSSIGDSSCRAPENLLRTVKISPLLRFMDLRRNHWLGGEGETIAGCHPLEHVCNRSKDRGWPLHGRYTPHGGVPKLSSVHGDAVQKKPRPDQEQR